MTGELKNASDAYFHLMDAFADSLIEMPEAEFNEESGDEDGAEDVRAVLMKSIQLGRKQLLNEARKQLELTRQSIDKMRFDIPSTVPGKRELLQSMLGSMQQKAQSVLTGQFRDFEEVADEDLDGIIQQLIALQDAEGRGE